MIMVFVSIVLKQKEQYKIIYMCMMMIYSGVNELLITRTTKNKASMFDTVWVLCV